jgi:hypothetical protein
MFGPAVGVEADNTTITLNLRHHARNIPSESAQPRVDIVAWGDKQFFTIVAQHTRNTVATV